MYRSLFLLLDIQRNSHPSIAQKKYTAAVDFLDRARSFLSPPIEGKAQERPTMIEVSRYTKDKAKNKETK